MLRWIQKVDEDYIWLFIFYFFSQGLIFSLGNAVFWDDWAYVGAPAEDILNEFSQSGDLLNFRGWVYILFLNIMPAWVYKAATFFSIFLSGVFLYKISARDMRLDRKIAFWVATLFLTSPLYIARVACTDFNYTLSVFLFMLAWWWIDRFRYFSLFLFALAFNTQSLLMFYALPFIYFYLNNKNKYGLVEFLFRNADFILLPFLWFIIKSIYFPPYGSYENYNTSYNIWAVVPAMKNQWLDLLSFFYNFIISFANFGIKIVVLLVTIFFVYKKLTNRYYELNLRGGVYLFVIGVLSLILGLFPYWVLGYVPTFWEWTSRYQLLMPFGVAFIIVALAGLIKPWMQRLFFALCISLSISINISNFLDFYNDWNKQKEIVKFLSGSELARDASLLVFRDKTPNAIFREYRFYEWNGIINKAFPGDFTRFGIGEAQMNDYKNGSLDGQFVRFYATRRHLKLSDGYPLLVSIVRQDDRFYFKAEYLKEN